MNANRINNSSESGNTNAGGAEMFFLFLFESGIANGERRDYGKVLNYEDRMKLENVLKEYINT